MAGANPAYDCAERDDDGVCDDGGVRDDGPDAVHPQRFYRCFTAYYVLVTCFAVGAVLQLASVFSSMPGGSTMGTGSVVGLALSAGGVILLLLRRSLVTTKVQHWLTSKASGARRESVPELETEMRQVN